MKIECLGCGKVLEVESERDEIVFCGDCRINIPTERRKATAKEKKWLKLIFDKPQPEWGKTKVLIVLTRWKGGVGRVVSLTKKELERRGYHVEVISREDDLKCFSFKSSIKPLRAEVRSRNYDILYTQDWSCSLALTGFKNHYTCYHGLSPTIFGKILQRIVSWIRGKKLVVVSDFLKEKYPQSTIVYNCVDPKQFFDKRKQRRYYGYISRGYDQYTDENYELEAKIYGLKTSVAKDIPPEKMNDWYNTLKVFASYPPSYAGFNLCWIEAIKSGVPVVMGNKFGIGIVHAQIKIEEFNIKKQVDKLIDVFNEKY